MTVTISVAPQMVTPGGTLGITGSGFGASEVVDVYVDTTDVALTVSNGAGAVAYTLKTALIWAPGQHYVTLAGRRTGRAAQAGFVIRSNWLQYQHDVGRSGTTKTETVVGPYDVAQLTQDWDAAAGYRNGYAWVPLQALQPLVSDQVIYVEDPSGTAIDAFPEYCSQIEGAVCTPSKQFETSNPLMTEPAISGGNLYAVTTGGSPSLFTFTLEVFNLGCTSPCAPAGSTVVWTGAGEPFLSPILAAGGQVYVTVDGAAGGLYAFGGGSSLPLQWYASGRFRGVAVAAGRIWSSSLDTNQEEAFPAACGTGGAACVASTTSTSYGSSDLGATYAEGDVFGFGFGSTPNGVTAWTPGGMQLGVGSSPQVTVFSSYPITVAGPDVYVRANLGDNTADVVEYSRACLITTNAQCAPVGAALASGSGTVEAANGILYVSGDGLLAYPAELGSCPYDGSVGMPRCTTALWSGAGTSYATAPATIVDGNVFEVDGVSDVMHVFDLPGSSAMSLSRARPALRSLHPDPSLRIG